MYYITDTNIIIDFHFLTQMRNQERNQRKKYRKNISDDSERTTLWRMNNSNLILEENMLLLFASLISSESIFAICNFGINPFLLI